MTRTPSLPKGWVVVGRRGWSSLATRFTPWAGMVCNASVVISQEAH